MNLSTGLAFAYLPVKALLTAVAFAFATFMFLLIFALSAFLFRFFIDAPFVNAFRYAASTPKVFDSSWSVFFSSWDNFKFSAFFSSMAALLFNCF